MSDGCTKMNIDAGDIIHDFLIRFYFKSITLSLTVIIGLHKL